MEIKALALPGVFEITPRRFHDRRGYFSETYSAARLADAGIDIAFVQDNQSYSAMKGVLRGLHYQLPPFAQAKLVRVTRGAVFDVVVDIRRTSPRFGHWLGLTLSAEQGNQVLVPVGFAHGLVSLSDGVEVQYKVSAGYSAIHERTIRYDDPAIGIVWPDLGAPLLLSERDAAAGPLAEAELFP